jgi:hypothetical protein
MIIKSLSRKAGWRTGKGSKKGTNSTSAFGSLIAYMNRADKDERIKAVLWHNFYADERTIADDIRRTFERNAAHLKERKNGNVLYHEMLSFSNGHRLDDATLDRVIADIGQAYLNERAVDQLAYGVIHKDTEHIHLHLMISANNVDKSDRVRLSKADFAEIQKRVEAYVLEKYPELEQTQIYAKTRHQEKLKTQAHEQAMKSRTGKTSRKEQVKTQLHQMFERAQSYDELAKLIQGAGIEMYQRGKSVGVVVRDADGAERRHRLASLGVLEHYERTNARLSGQKRTQGAPSHEKDPTTQAQEQRERTKPYDAFARKPTEVEKQFDAFATGKPADTTKETEQARRIRELREARDAQDQREANEREQGRGQDDDIGRDR